MLPVGRSQVRSQLPRILEDAENALPHLARDVFADQYTRLCEFDRVIDGYDRKIGAMAKAQEATKRLMQLEGVGPLTATALVATVGDIKRLTTGGSLQLGWGWCRVSGHQVEKLGMAELPNGAMFTCGHC